MVLHNTCECGWKSKTQSSSTRAIVAHMKTCPLREKGAKGKKTLNKRGAPEANINSMEGASLEPPHKVPRLSVVSVGDGDGRAA
jgi:hypothetical protein